MNLSGVYLVSWDHKVVYLHKENAVYASYLWRFEKESLHSYEETLKRVEDLIEFRTFAG